MRGSYNNIPKAIFYLIRGDYILDRSLVPCFMTIPLRGITQKKVCLLQVTLLVLARHGGRWIPIAVPSCLEGHADLVNGLIMGIVGVIIWLIRVLNLLTKSP